MKNMQVGYLKAHFSDVIAQVIGGEKITINYGRKKKKVAVIVPYPEHAGNSRRIIGIREKHASYRIKASFKMTDEDMLRS